MKIYLSIFLLGLYSLTLGAQQYRCGLPGGEEDRILIDRLKANKKLLNSASYERSAVSRYIPVVLHDIQRADGSGAMNPARLFDQMCSLNEFYAEQGTDIQFYLKDINIIQNNTVYTDHEGTTGSNIMNSQRDNKALNVYIPEDANTGSQSLGITLGYFSPFWDWIVIRPAEVNKYSNTLWHEVGHYLSLPHPFRGWDHEAYDPAIHGEQVGTYSPDGILNEFQNGNNCSIAGDLICDTPPDYNHFDTDWGCNYLGGAKDPNGDLIDPDETNVMSYFGCSENTFSQDQIDLINADLSSRLAMNELVLGTEPAGISLGNPATLVEPINEEAVPNNANIFFDWEDVPNASGYILEIDIVSSFGLLPVRFGSEESEIYFDGSNLNNNKKYYWRVRGFNDYDHCSDWSEAQPFKTTTVSSTKIINEVSAISIFPNPISENSIVNLFVSASQAFDGELSILNIAGQNISTRNLTIQKGENNVELSVADLPKGMYLINLIGNSGLMQEKLLVN